MSSTDHLIKPAIEERVKHLLAQMTTEEKIGQTNQIHPFGSFQPDEVRRGWVGSILNAAGALTGLGTSASSNADDLNEIQRVAIKESHLGIPLLFGRDVIHGYRTVFPIPLGQAASWNPDLVEKAAAVSAREASADGIKWTFAPMIDVARDPRWGRVAEGPGEDPYLGSLLAAAAVRGFQGDDFSRPDHLVACAKHFVGYGGAEGGRDYEGIDISMRTLRDVYLPPYRAAVDAGVATLMSAFHDLSGIPLSAHYALLTGLLRKEMGFQGFVVSDWESVRELVNHGIAVDETEAAGLGMHAGVDMDMVSQVYRYNLLACLERGLITQAELDEAVWRILRIKFLAGLFDEPFTDPQRAHTTILAPEHRSLARQFAQQAIVLLKNEADLLPLNKDRRRIAVVGPLVHASEELYGTWTPDGRAEDVTPLSEAFQANAPAGMHLVFSELVDDALRLAATADVVVAVVGEHPSRSGENSNVAALELPPGQSEFVQALAEQGKPVVLVVIAGRPLAITKEARLAQAVLYAFHPGIEGGAALADLVFGGATPCARLPISLPRATGQVPVYYGHKPSGRPTTLPEFSRRYVDLPHAPLYPFGWGLSFTTFNYGNLSLSSEILESSLEVSAEITNIGAHRGMETVQLYVRDRVASVTRPVKELKGFQQITLGPGETRRVTFQLRPTDLAFTGLDDKTVVEPGDFDVWIGPNSTTGLQGSFTFL